MNFSNERHYRKHFSASDIDEGVHLLLEPGEVIHGQHKLLARSQHKTFGNRYTDYIVVTNCKVMVVYLVQAYLGKNDSFNVDYIPYSVIRSLEHETRLLKPDIVKIEYLWSGSEDELAYYTFNLGTKAEAFLKIASGHIQIR